MEKHIFVKILGLVIILRCASTFESMVGGAFSAVSRSGLEQACATDVASEVITSHGAIWCGISCLTHLSTCHHFNYVQTTHRCDLFFFPPASYGVVQDCIGYHQILSDVEGQSTESGSVKTTMAISQPSATISTSTTETQEQATTASVNDIAAKTMSESVADIPFTVIPANIDSPSLARDSESTKVTAYTPRPPGQLRNLSVAMVDVTTMRVYIDGIEITNLQDANTWNVAGTVQLPSTARVIAFNGTSKDGSPPLFMASTDDGFILTNSSWKCTNETSTGWQNVGFDDSSWSAATEFKINGNNSDQVPGIRPDAYWIDPHCDEKATNFYCRKQTGF